MTKLEAMFRRAGAGRVGRVLPPAPVLILAAGGPARAQESETIRKIEVVGAVKLTPETVIFRSGLKVGMPSRSFTFWIFTPLGPSVTGNSLMDQIRIGSL